MWMSEVTPRLDDDQVDDAKHVADRVHVVHVAPMRAHRPEDRNELIVGDGVLDVESVGVLRERCPPRS